VKRSTCSLVLLSGIALCGVSASGIRAQVLDDYEQAGAGQTLQKDQSATLSTQAVSGVTGNGLQLTYGLLGGNYVQIEKNYSTLNFLKNNANTLQIDYKATGVVNSIETKFTDSDSTDTSKCDKLDFKFLVNNDGAWHRELIPLSSFTTFTEGDASFGIDAVSKMAFGVVTDNGQAGSGTVSIDNVRLIRADAWRAVIDSAERGTLVNSRGLTVARFDEGTGSSGSLAYVTTQTVAGAYGLEMVYSVVAGSGKYSGFEEPLGGMVAPTGNEKLVFWVKGTVGFEPLVVELWYNNGAALVSKNVSSYGNITTSFQKYSIPLSDFAGVNLKSLSKIKFVVTTFGAGTLYFDDIAIEGPSSTAETVMVLDDFSKDLAQTGWTSYAASSATFSHRLGKDGGPSGSPDENRVIYMTYSFPHTNGLWAIVERELRPNFYTDQEFRFKYKGDGAVNDLEVKVEDANGTVYRRVMADVTDTNNAWIQAAIPMNEFAFFTAGTSSTLDLKRISKVSFAIAKGSGGSGTFVLDDLESGSPVAFQKLNLGSVIVNVSTPDNPFSPNGDGIKDTAKFVYTLGRTARVVLKIYNLHGQVVRVFDKGEQLAGEHVIEWDGIEENGDWIGNGLCFFRLEAEGAGGERDMFKELIGVVR